MEHLSINVSKLLGVGYSLVKYTSLSQQLLESNNIILWNDTPSIVEFSTYNDFKDSIKRRGSKFYNCTSIISYADFCIALLCANSYSLNSLSTPNIPDRSYAAAWRGIVTVSETSTDKVKQWLNSSLAGRSASGYSLSRGLSDITIADYEELEFNDQYSKDRTEDQSIILAAVRSKSIVEIMGDEGSSLKKVTSSPEAQLFDIKLHHLLHMSKKK